jgi:hypothetical protein
MGITRTEQLFRCRDLLGNPFPDAPSFHQLLRQEISEERDVVNALNNTGIAWGLATYQLNFTPNTNEYLINVDNFGKILFVTKNTLNPYIPEIQVAFQDVSDQLYGTVWSYIGNSNYAQAFVLQVAPERMSFYRAGVLNAQPTVKINPVPQESATYNLTYLPGYLGTDDPLESGIQLPEHAELVRLRAATALLPYAKWYEEEAMNQNKRKELAQAFAYQLDRKESIFKEYIKGINRPRITSIADWNEYA